MTFKQILPFMALPLIFACGGQQAALTTGIDIADLDTTVAPGTDFFRYATGGWADAHPLTAEYARFGSFEYLDECNNKQLRELIEGVAAQQNPEGSLAAKIAAMYNSAMDSVNLNKQGMEPIREDLQRIDRCYDKDELYRLYSSLQLNGMDGMFDFGIDADIKDSKNNLAMLYQSGLHMGQKEYYIDTDSATAAIRDAYKAYMAQLFTRCKVASEADAAARVEAAYAVEERLAKASKSRTELRDDEANYHKMSLDSLMQTFPALQWKHYFGILGAQDIREVNVGQPEFIREVEAIWQETPLETLKDYVRWQLIDTASSYLDDEMRAASFGFYGTVMSGRQEDRPRWKRAVAATERALGEAVGQLYVEKYFPAAAKDRMIQLVKNLQVALGERIDAQEWMSDSTKAVAHEKLDAFIVKVGYPDKWKDYSALELGRNYWENYKATAVWAYHDLASRKLNKPVDNTEWYMPPQMINAYYNPTTNEICFPAGILQPPFFDMQADDAFNYGAIGVVIGHEMTHGFDDQGSKYDKDGNLRQWWTAEDRQRFEERTHVMRDFFNNIEVLPGLHANGQLTLGENMADHGGLQVAFQAFKNAQKAITVPEGSPEGPSKTAAPATVPEGSPEGLSKTAAPVTVPEGSPEGSSKTAAPLTVPEGSPEGLSKTAAPVTVPEGSPEGLSFTPEQRFFLAYAKVWANNIRDEEIRQRTKSDPHALGRWRVNGALPHIDAWYDAFGITESDPMFVPKSDRVTIW